MDEARTKEIIEDSVDKLVIKGLAHIKETGEKVSARGLSGLQSYNVNYILTNPRNRVHTLRLPDSVKYLAKELMVFFSGSLKATDFADASKSWLKWADENGNIESNYGYYVFHQKTPEGNSQYEWVANLLHTERLARRAVINIHQPKHKKTGAGDIPCAAFAHFFIQHNKLCCIVTARATDIVTGLCYNMGFFSLVTELLFADLIERGVTDLELGYCMMKSNLTQLYDSQLDRAQKIEANQETCVNLKEYQMPEIKSAKALLNDIYNNTKESEVMKWCVKYSS